MIRTLTVVSILLSTIAWGQAPAQRLTLIKAGRLFDARSGQMLSNQAILVEGDRIKEVGIRGSPDDTRYKELRYLSGSVEKAE